MNQYKPHQWLLAMGLALVMALGTTPVSVLAYTATENSGEIIAFEALPEETADRQVSLGLSLEDLALPDTLNATVRVDVAADADEPVQESGEPVETEITVEIPVRWTSEPEYGGDMVDTYNFTAEVEGYTLNAALPQITVTVQDEETPPQTGGEITAFTALEESTAMQSVALGTPLSGINLLSSLSATVDGEEAEVPVTWTSVPEYSPGGDTEQPGEYVFTPQLGDGYTLAEDVSAPKITVAVTAMTAFGRAMASAPTTPTEVQEVIDAAENGSVLNLTELLGDVPEPAIFSGYTFTVGNNRTLTFTGKSTYTALVFGSGNNITIDNLNLKSASRTEAETTDVKGYSPLHFTGTGNKLTIKGSGNKIENGQFANLNGYGAAVGVPEGAGLVIEAVDEDAKLTATGGYGAGIGGGYKQNAGSVTINSGQITCKQTTNSYAAGIGGGGEGGNGGSITINGGTLSISGNKNGAGIGGGGATSNGATGGSGGTIAINGGYISIDCENSTGIGGGSSKSGTSGSGGAITINGGMILVKNSYVGIGGGYVPSGTSGTPGTPGTIIINGGHIDCDGLYPVGKDGSSVAPKNSSNQPLYLNRLYFDSYATDRKIVGGFINGVAFTEQFPLASGYGIKDVKMRPLSTILSLWLPASSDKEVVSVTLEGGLTYSAEYKRVASAQNQTMLMGTETYWSYLKEGVLNGSIDSISFEAAYMPDTAQTIVLPENSELRINGDMENVAFVCRGNNTITLSDADLKTANNHEDSSNSEKSRGVFDFLKGENVLILNNNSYDVSNSLSSGQTEDRESFGQAIYVADTASLQIKPKQSVDYYNYPLSLKGSNAPAIYGKVHFDLTARGTIDVTGGSGYSGIHGDVTMSGGKLNITAKEGGNGITGNAAITGGRLTATAEGDGTGIIGDTAEISGGTVIAQSKGSGAGIASNSIVITGGSVNAQMSSQPTNGSLPVYLNELFSESKANRMVSAGKIAGIDCANMPDAAAGVYGIKDMYFDSASKLHIWLPSSSEKEEVSFVTGDQNLSAEYQRISGKNTQVLRDMSNISNAVITLSFTEATYDGTKKEPSIVSVTLYDRLLAQGTDYETVITSADTGGASSGVNAGTVTMTFTGKGNYTGTKTATYVIKRANQAAFSITPVTGKTFGDGAITLEATGGSDDGAVTYSVPDSNGVLSISGSTATILGAGTVTVTATKAASTNYNETSAAYEITIAKAVQTISITEVTGKRFGDNAFTLETTGGIGTGEVVYTVPANNGVLSIDGSTATILGAGNVTVTAVKAADNNYNSVSATYDLTIGKAAAPTINYPTAGSITYGQKLSESGLTGGSIEYGGFAWSDGETVPTVSNIGYEVTFTPNEATAKNYETITGTAETVDLTIIKATPGITVNAVVSGDSGSRQAVLTATVTGVTNGEMPTGMVQFLNTTDGGTVSIGSSAPLSTDTATFTWTGLAEQVYKVKAVYSGSENYDTATSEEVTFDTCKQIQTPLSIVNIGAKTYGDSSFTLATSGGSGMGAVTFESSDPAVLSISGNTATIHKAGTVSITAAKAQDSIYNEATTSVSLTIGKKALTVKAEDKLNIIKGSAMPELTHTVNGLVNGDTFTDPTISTTAAVPNTVGNFDILISGGNLTNSDSYSVTYTNGRLTVVNAVYPVMVINGTGSGSYSEGQLVTITASSRSGYTFTGWSTTTGNVTFTDSSASTTTFVMPGAAVCVTANYKQNGGGSGSGGGSSSGGSSGSTITSAAATPAKTPNQPVTAAVPVTAAAGRNGSANASIPERSVTDAIAKAQADAKAQGKTANGTTVALNVTMPKGATALTVNLPRNSLNSLVSAGVTSLELNGSPVTVSFDTKALAEIQKQSSGNISITIVPNAKLAASAKTMIDTRPVYDLTVSYTKDGKNATVSSFGGGTATVSVPYTPAKSEAIGGLYAVYADAKGNATRIAGSAYDVNSGCVIFTTTHFSRYGVGYTAPSAKFTDITTHWAKESIDYVVGRGLLSGTAETTFAPDTAMTRGMLVTALGRLASVDTESYATNSFTDVTLGSAFRPYIEWAYKKGIVQGTGNGKFEPNRAITREEIAVIFANFAKATGYTLPVTRTATTYADAFSIGSAYKTAVTAMQQASIMMGGTGNKFNPKSSATRAEASSMLHRYIKLTIDPDTAQGWAKNDAGQYLYYKDSKALTGTQIIGGKKYFFNADGSLARSIKIDDYEVDENGMRKTK